MNLPRKRFGQHFLCDQAIVQRIVVAIAPKTNEHLIEIGPGQGAITVPILKLAKQLQAVELDRDLIPQLEERAEPYGRLEIFSADVLAFDFSSIKKDDRLLRVFGNLPYNISTPLIFHLLSFAPLISDMVFMLQKEVADRLAAEAGDDTYGRLSVMAQYHCRIDLLFDVPATAFFPPPKVESSIVRLVPYRELPHPAKDYALFSSVVKNAFGQRRKTLRNSLKSLVDDAVWARVKVDPTSRAEELSVSDFVAISNALSTNCHPRESGDPS